jgi:hypothetical protein
MKPKAKSIFFVSIAYAAALALFLLISYVLTNGGVGWEFFTAVLIALLSFPLYISVISILRALEFLCKKEGEFGAENEIGKRVLGIISLCLVALTLLSLTSVSVSIAIHIKNEFIRDAIATLSLPTMLWCCVGNIFILLYRPLSKFVAFVKRKKKERK